MKTAEIDAPMAKKVPAPAQPALPTRQLHVRGRSAWWVYLILILLVAGFGYFIYTRLVSAHAATAAANDKHKALHDLPVVVTTARRGNLDQYLLGLGSVTPLNTVTVKSRVDGAITRVAFVEGQMVKEGDLLIEIDARPYEAVLKQAQGQLAKDKAAKDSADWNVQQDQLAIKDKGISQQVLHNDTATRDQAAGAIEIDQAQIDTAQLNLTYAHITSPISGRIGLRLVDVGNIVHANDTTGLAVINQLQPITVVFTLPEDNIAQIQKRSASGEPLLVEAYNRDLTDKLSTGTVLAIDNEIDSTTGTLRIKARFDNQDNSLFPSQFVNARMLVNTINDAVLVPSAAVQHSPSSTFAFVVTPGKPDGEKAAPTDSAPAKVPGKSGKGDSIKGVVTMRELTVGPSQAAVGSDGTDTTVILSGLAPGDIVVTDGVDKLQEGSVVIAHQAPAATGAKHATSGPSTMSMPSQGRRHSKS